MNNILSNNKSKHVRICFRLLFVVFCVCMLTGCQKNISNLEAAVTEKISEIVAPEENFPETTLREEDLEYKFYYHLIDTEEERQVYKELYEGLTSCSEEIYVHGNSETAVSSLIDFVLYDFPEIFWCDAETTVYYELIERFGVEYMIIYPEYPYSKEEISAMQQEVESMTQECIAICQTQGSDYEKVKYIYEYMIDSIAYDENALNSQNIYSALVAKQSVCAGYAKGVQYLLERAGVECVTVGGEALDEDGNQQGHAWNLVKCDGEYYYVDATWGDMEVMEEEIPNLRRYDYLCCSEAELSKTHTPEYEEILPDCASEELNYYRMNGMFYDTFDSDQVMSAMKSSLVERQEYTTFKFGSKEAYEMALEKIENTLLDEALTYQMNYYGMEESNCSYDYDEWLWKINIYWSYS